MVETWIIYAFLGFIGYFFVNFLFKYVASENPLLVSLFLYGTAAVSVLVVLLSKMQFSMPFSISPKLMLIAALIGICSVTGTIFALKSIELAPNPGYSTAIYSANFVVLTLISVVVFDSSLTFIKLLGTIAVFVGLVLLSI